MAAMKSQYGAKKAKQVFYASKNKGTITGIDKSKSKPMTHKPGALLDAHKRKSMAKHADVKADKKLINEKLKQVLHKGKKHKKLAAKTETKPVKAAQKMHKPHGKMKKAHKASAC